MTFEYVLKFDSAFYLDLYRDVAASELSPLQHYHQYGIFENRWPNPYFCPSYYKARYAKELANTTDVFGYFNDIGVKKGHVSVPNFSPKWYAEQNKDVKQSDMPPFIHFAYYGDKEFRNPSPSFNPHAYVQGLNQNADSITRPFIHWLMASRNNFSWRREIFRQQLMDTGVLDIPYYIGSNFDVAQNKLDPFEHFVCSGARELRSPRRGFNLTQLDRLMRPVFANDIDPEFGVLEHYLSSVYDNTASHERNFYRIWSENFDPMNSSGCKPQQLGIERSSPSNTSILYGVDRVDCDYFDVIIKNIETLNPRPANVGFFCRAPEIQNGLRAAIKRANLFISTSYISNEQDFDRFLDGTQSILLCMGKIILRSEALNVLEQAQKTANADICYCDHDLIAEQSRHSPVFKPAISRIYLSQNNYIGNVLLIRSAKIGQEGRSLLFNAFKDTDSKIMTSLCQDRNFTILRVPYILYHDANDGEKEPRACGVTKLPARRDKTVAIIIPTRDKVEYLKPCIESIFAYTDYDSTLIEIFIVDNGSVEQATKNFLDIIGKRSNVTILRYDEPFNFSNINNFAATKAKSETLVFLNNDTFVRDPGWLEKIVAYASLPEVGAVGCKLLYSDDTIQHGGCIVGAAGGYVEHLLAGKHVDEVASCDFTREMSVVTGACLGVETKKFSQVGGFKSALRVAWNDVYLCLSLLEHGYSNIYISDPLFYHYESKSRGIDDTDEKKNQFAWEASYTRAAFPHYFLSDPSYNQNLSLESAGHLAVPPRVFGPSSTGFRPKRVLMLSVVYNIGYGVPVVMEKQASRMIEQGWEVHLGGPSGNNEITFPDCTRVVLATAQEAALYAYRNNIMMIVSHTPPFFRVTDYVGRNIKVICYDYGEPSPSFFDAGTKSYLEEVNRQKLLAFSLAAKTAAISDAVRGEGAYLNTEVIKLGNDHLSSWSPDMIDARLEMRKKHGWDGKTVVLNVCRFPKIERYYKGVDKYAAVYSQFNFSFARSSEFAWVLAGAAGPDDVKEMERFGLTVFANLSNEELIKLYAAVDVYMSFSKWEGYNLGIGQALAMGLPVAASDIEAHREFPIFTSNSAIGICGWLNELAPAADRPQNRSPRIFEWRLSASKFEDLLSDVLEEHEGYSF